jgi:hypothetical protein
VSPVSHYLWLTRTSPFFIIGICFTAGAWRKEILAYQLTAAARGDVAMISLLGRHAQCMQNRGAHKQKLSDALVARK